MAGVERNDIIKMTKLEQLKGICLTQATNSYIEIPFVEMNRADLYKLKRSKWNFDWLDPLKNGFRVYGLVLNHQIHGLIAVRANYDNQSVAIDIVEGAQDNIGKTGKIKVGGCLFGFAGYLSFKMGFDGYVYFDAKTELITHFKSKYHAIQIGNSQRMILNTRVSQILVKKYIKEVQ